MRRSYPAVVEQHKALLASKERESFADGLNLLRDTNLSPQQVKTQLGYSNKFIKFVRENHPEFLRNRVSCNRIKNLPSKVAKYAEAVALLSELKSSQCNAVMKAAEAAGVNYHSFRLHIYTYHRELIGLDPAKNRNNCTPRNETKYAEAAKLLAAEPKQPENLILYVADKLGLNYHALRAYIYTHHPDLTQRKRLLNNQRQGVSNGFDDPGSDGKEADNPGDEQYESRTP